MKTISAILVALCVSTHWTSAQTASASPTASSVNPGQATPSDTPWAETKSDGNSSIWQRTTYESTPDGKQIPHIRKYTELATGLHYQKNGQWVDSKEEINILPNGTAAATEGQHQAYFPRDIYQGVVELVTPDGTHLRSRPLGLSYDDGTNTVLIAELKGSVGQLVGFNQVIYPDAFTDFKADLRYTYTKAGFEQDVILREQPLTPESYGLNPATARLQVLTEFFNPPQPAVTTRVLPKQAGIALSDENLDFGAMKMMPGRAFLLGSDAHEGGALVSKSWVRLDGRQFLVEEVPVEALANELAQLPVPQTASTKPDVNSALHVASAKRLLPAQRLVKTNPTGQFKQVAQAATPAQGLVLDYQTLNSSQTNYTFQGDTTYYISGSLSFWGTNTFEGGTVIKFSTNGSIAITPGPPGTSPGINWKAGAYRPVIFTAKDDNTVGESIGTGSPTGYYGNPMLSLASFSSQTSLVGLRMSYAKTGIQFNGASANLYNAQFVNCQNGLILSSANVFIGNALFANTKTNFIFQGGSGVTAQNATISGSLLLASAPSTQSGDGLALTNCILANVTNLLSGVLLSTNGNYNGFYNAPYVSNLGPVSFTNIFYPFQSVGAGNYYLATGCVFTNVGTTNIDPTLSAALKQKTTHPPIVYSNITIYVATNFSPQAQRDTNNSPYLGYHYDPLDYVFGAVIAKSNLTFTAGTAAGWFYNSSGGTYGLAIGDSATAIFNGTVIAPCRWSRYNTVQEGGNGFWQSQSYLGGITGQSYSQAAPAIQAQFTICSMLNNEGNVFRDNSSLLNINATDCEFWSGGAGDYYASENFTNCLFVNSAPGLWYNYGAANLTLQNCTLIRGSFMADHTQGSTWPVKIFNCAFDGTAIYMNAHSLSTNGAYCDYNAFLTNANLTTIMGGHEVTNLVSFNWQTSWLGNYFLPTNHLPANSWLIDRGSTNANLLGLYHFTTQTNQVKETNSVVDIGYHYVAVDTNGIPIDTNGDGIPDYIEDANGNGLVDNGEISWTNMDLDGDGIPNSWEIAHGLNPFDPTDALQDPDYDGRNNLQEYQDGTDLFNPNSVLLVPLGYWRFDNTNTWVGNAGQLPLVASNIFGVPSWNTNAVLIDSANAAILKYRDVETNGNANINLRDGTIRFWFKPDWSSTNAGGVGPQNEGRLIEMGAEGSTNGWWGLLVNSAGTNIYFGTQTNSASTLTTNLAASISWASNYWHQIVLTYSTNCSSLYLDGQPVTTNGLGVVYYPGLDVRAQGFTVGSSSSGTNQVRGVFDELETFNYPLDANSIQTNYQAVSHQDRDGNGLPDIWEMDYFGHLGVDPNADPDGDGWSNLHESQNGTDPNKFDFIRLGYWRFNDVPNWQDDQGLNPSTALGVVPVSSWSGDAVRVSSQLQGVLAYPGIRTNTVPVVACPSGSIRFWFKPEWNSWSTNQEDGGAGDTIRLFEIGRQTADATYGWFALIVNPQGTKMIFSTEADGVHTDFLQPTVQFNVHAWCQVVLDYSPQETKLYLNGQLLATGPGLVHVPTNAVLQQGFHLGCSWDGVHQANGCFDELETFNYELSDTNIAADYQSKMSVLAVDGLPVIVANAWGARFDTMDSDCDGLPDAWEVTNGLNPADPSDATTAALQAYEGITGVSTGAYAHVISPGDIINIDFTGDTNAASTMVHGPAVAGYGLNDAWNFFNTNSDVLYNGQSLKTADNSPSGAKLFAYIGPCKNVFWYADCGYQMGPLNVLDSSIPSTSSKECGFLTGMPVFSYDFVSPNGVGLYSRYCIDVLCSGEAGPDAAVGGGLDFFYRFGGALGEVANFCHVSESDFLGYYLYQWNGMYPYYDYIILSDADARQQALADAIDGSTNYAQHLYTYITTTGGYSCTVGAYPAYGDINCYIPAFIGATNVPVHAGDNAMAGDGFVFDYPNVSSQLSSYFRTHFPDSKRTILVPGLQHGTYGVYIYYAGPTNTPPPQINGVTSVAEATAGGGQYWYARVSSSPDINPGGSLSSWTLAATPPWALVTSADSLQIDMTNPPITDASQDITVLGLQIVQLNAAVTPVFEVRPGKQAAYLIWEPSAAATNYNVYRAVGSTNTWTSAGSTPQLVFQDTNVNVGTTYYYMVVGADELGAGTNSAIVSVVPFGCANPLPPRIDYVAQLQIPAVNGTYPVNYQMLLTNSDAFDYQGYPLVFMVDSVVSGSLMIDGLPFSVGNNTIGTNDSVVWMPPSMQASAGTPAFRVYVFDGFNRSTNVVNVSIKQHPQVFLMGWGNNLIRDWATTVTCAGCLGTGSMHTELSPSQTLTDISGYPAFEFQDMFGIFPFESRWQLNNSNDDPNDIADWGSYDNWLHAWMVLGDPPKRVLDLNEVISVSTFGWNGAGHCAVTSDKHLWFWGDCNASVVGMPLVMGFTNVPGVTIPFGITNWDSSKLDQNNITWVPLDLTLLSPVPVQDPQTGQPMTGVVAAKYIFILKDDGSLWSFGPNGPTLGRELQLPTDLYPGNGGIGMIPGRVELDGNNNNGIVRGREIIEINTSCQGAGCSALARCKDGSLWTWGSMYDCGCDGDSINLQLAGTDADPWTPTRLTNVESASTSPIIQISECWNHIVLLREDSSLSEIGYIPEFDSQRLANCDGYSPGFYFTKPSGCADFDNCYSIVPITVSNTPPNIRQISAGISFGALLTYSGEVWLWGQWLGQILPVPQKIQNLSGIVKIAAGDQYIIALDKKGRLWGVGINNEGVFGYNDVSIGLGSLYEPVTANGVFHSNAVQVAGIENVVDIFTGDNDFQSSQVYAMGTEVQGKPVGLVATAMNQAVQLSWSNYQAASSYIIYRSLNEEAGYVAIGHSTINSYWDQSPPLQNGQNYYYEVSAVVNGVETSPSWEVVATPYPPPTAVTNLTASWACHGVKLQWQAPTNVSASPLEEYMVMRGNLQLAELFPNAIDYYDDTAVMGSNYTYTVVALNSAGTASASASPSGSIPCDPAPVIATNNWPKSWLSVAPNYNGGSDQATLAWVGPTNGDWLFKATEFDTDVGAGTETVSGFVSALTQAYPLPAWLWSQFIANGVDTSTLSDANASVNTQLGILVPALNRVLTNGQPVSNLDFFVSAVQNGHYPDGYFYSAPLRRATTNLFNALPQGAALVQLKRMLLDDYFGGQFFTRGGNWGDNLTGFRIHYRTMQYANGCKLEQTLHQDVSVNNIKYEHSTTYHDDEGMPCYVYKYSWSIPQGSVCWASVSAMVDGQESDVSIEAGPQAANYNSGNSWNSSFRAIPGYQQVYLDWSDDPNAMSYNVYYSTDSNDTNSSYLHPGLGSWQPVPPGVGLQINRCWHTNLTVTTNTTYYYMLIANDYFTDKPHQLAFATVTTNTVQSVTNQFSAYASAYDSMVLVEWTVPTNQYTVTDTSVTQTNWQFFVERRPALTDDTNYQLIADSGYGLAYLDPDVVDGQSYTYRVTAFDYSFNRLQALAVARGGTSTQITPSATNVLTLLPPVPGNGYVDLTWSPIRATEFSIKHSLNPGGPFDVVDSLNANNVYQNARNTYRDTGLQNGVMHYFQIAAITPTGFEIDSDVKGAMPLSTLAPLPPTGFQGAIVPISDATQPLFTNTVSLSWNAESGVNQYQVFLQNQTSLTPLFTGRGTACTYVIPDAQQLDNTAVFTFALRSVNAQGLAGDLVETVVTNQARGDVADTPSAVVLQISGTLGSLTVTGPTNLTLSAEVNVPGVQQVSFYDGGTLIGTAGNAPYLITWYQVPGGPHTVTAVAVATSQSATGFISGGSGSFSSDGFSLQVYVEPQLAAYQTSATDLQLPAPTLPIALSRSYSSRNTDTNGPLGVGWTASWAVGSVKLSYDLAGGWSGVTQIGFAGQTYCYISDQAGHDVTVTLPNGQSIGFAPQLQYDTSPVDYYHYPSVELNTSISISFQPFASNSGTFSAGTSLASAALSSPEDDYCEEWGSDSNTLESVTMSQISYTAPDGTFYQFGQPGIDNLTWLLTKTTDRNGNSLTYTYDSNNNLQSISNSCGRSVSFAYSNPQAGVTNISVYDAMGGPPVVVYVVSNNLLTDVDQLTNRNPDAVGYQKTRYMYGTTGADANRLTDVFDARGVRVLHNIYTNSASGDFTGDVMVQISPGRTNAFQVDADYNLTVTTTSSTATNTAKVTSDASGTISGATVPVSGTSPSTTKATQCSYDNQGNLISQTDANGNPKTYAYDDQNRLVGQSDANGNSTSVELNSYGQPNNSTDANGKKTYYTYDNQGNTINVSDPSGISTSYSYSTMNDGNGNVLVGGLQASESQAAPFVPYTIVTTNVYDTSDAVKGDLLQTTEEWVDTGGNVVGARVTTSYTYDANGNRTTEIKQRTIGSGTGSVQQYIQTQTIYDAQNRVLTNIVMVSNDGMASWSGLQTNSVTYNELGKQATSTDAAGRVTTNIYDFNGNLIETAYPDGTVSRTSYDGFGRQQYVQERAVPSSGVTTAPATRNTYDASGRVIKVEKFASVTLTSMPAGSGDYMGPTGQIKMVATDPGNSALTTSRTFYDAVGRVQYSVDARGAVTQYLYDAAGRRTNVLVYATGYSPTNDTPPDPSTLGSAQSTSYAYDANGNQTTVIDAAGNTTTSVYDDANRVKEVDYPANNGTVSRFTYYDGLGRKIQETDEAGVSTAYTYDFRGLLTSVTLAFGTTQAVTTVYAYDELGNLTKQTDAAGHSTTNKYDALGRRTARILPGGQSEGFAYDPAGNVLHQTNFNGVVITNHYDVANRLTNCTSTGYNASYGYTQTGLRTNMVDASGTNSYTYDSLNRLTNKIVAWKGGPMISLNYRYDSLGSITNLWSSTANGVTNCYQYDVLGRLTNVFANGGSVSYNFDVIGNLQSMRYGNGVTNLYQYDSRNRLTNQVWKSGSTMLASFAYQLGATGNRTALAEAVNGTSRNYNWAYDYLYRLTGETINGALASGTASYAYDAVGNRTNRQSSISQLLTASYSYNANDWLNSDTYDTNGNTTISGSNTYQYDALNHLTNVNNGAILITYDGDGNRVSKKVGSTTTYYLLDDRNPSGYVQVLEEWTSTNTPALNRVYNYGLDLISQRVPNMSTNYFIYDGHGSTRKLTDAGGNVANVFTYDAYGTLIASNATAQTAYLYCGEQFDSDLGMYSLRARYYKPDSGRFWTMDTYEGSQEDPLSLHKYLYGADNPVNNSDPSGNKTVVVVNDSETPGAFEKHSADSAASHLQKAGWTVVYKDASAFINYTNSFEGMIFTGHGDEQQAAAINVATLESVLQQKHIKLDVGISLTCHGFDFISTVSRDGYTTPTALVIGYWGYAINNYDHRVRVGSAIDKWVANPTYTSIPMGNLLIDGAGQAGMGIAHVADVMIQIIDLGPMF
jgi:RHS repeat-associated protein